MLRQMAGADGDPVDETGVVHSQVLFEALEPRILLSADGFMPPPTPDMFDDSPEIEEVVLPPSEMDQEVAEELPAEEVSTLNPTEDPALADPAETLDSADKEDEVQTDSAPAAESADGGADEGAGAEEAVTLPQCYFPCDTSPNRRPNLTERWWAYQRRFAGSDECRRFRVPSGMVPPPL